MIRITASRIRAIRCCTATIVLAALVAGGAVARDTRTGAPSYAVSDGIAIGDGGWGAAAIDPAARRLYLAREGDVTVVDLARGKALPALGSLAGGGGVAVVPGTPQLLATSIGDASLRLLDTATGKEVAQIALSHSADAVAYDPGTGRALAISTDGAATAVDVALRLSVGTIALPAAPAAVAVGPDRIAYLSLASGMVAKIRLDTGAPVGTIALPGCVRPGALAVDVAGGRVIVACGNGKVALAGLTPDAGVTLLDTGRAPGSVMIDATRRRAFVAADDGVLSVIDLAAKGGPAIAARVPTEPGADTGALDPGDGAVYLVSARWGAGDKGGAARPVPGSVHVIAVRPR